MTDLPRLSHCERSPMRLIQCAVHSHRPFRLYLDPVDQTVLPIVSPALDLTHRYLDNEPMSSKGTELSLRPYEAVQYFNSGP